MTTVTQRQTHVIADAITMLRRNLLHIIRYPGLSMFTFLGPVVFLLLFVFVFGGTLGAGLPGVDPAGGRDAYLAASGAGLGSKQRSHIGQDFVEGV